MRDPSLRQIEALKAFVETGTVSRAAEVLRISQPAASKLLMTLELDTEIKLFERHGRRLTLTPQGMQLFNEIDRVFSGVSQIARSVDAIRQQERGRLRVGVMPAMSGPLVRRAVAGFLTRHPDVYVSVIERSSHFISNWLNSGQLDVGIVAVDTNERSVRSAPFSVESLVCIVPRGHRFADRALVTLQDIQQERFTAFSPNSITRPKIDKIFADQGLSPTVVLDTNTARGICDFVANGLGVSIVHPLTIFELLRNELSVVALHPTITDSFQICHLRECRNPSLVEAFENEIRKAAADSVASFRS